MVINRIFGTTTVSVELTSEEMEEVYRAKEREYRLKDAKNMLDAAASNGTIYRSDYVHIVDNPSLMEKLLLEFDKRLDCNVPENATWEESIKEVISLLYHEVAVKRIQQMINAQTTSDFDVIIQQLKEAATKAEQKAKNCTLRQSSEIWGEEAKICQKAVEIANSMSTKFNKGEKL